MLAARIRWGKEFEAMRGLTCAGLSTRVQELPDLVSRRKSFSVEAHVSANKRSPFQGFQKSLFQIQPSSAYLACAGIETGVEHVIHEII
jgi:hypothetical protein